MVKKQLKCNHRIICRINNNNGVRKRSLPPLDLDDGSSEPLDLTSTRSKKRQLHSVCGAKNCAHQNGNVYSEVLLRPELLKTVRGTEVFWFFF